MSEQWVFIEPQDVWMFRDSKPFTAQQNFVARTMFPPHPGTMQGVIRTFHLERQGVDWKAYARHDERDELYDAVGGPAYKDIAPSMGALRINGPFVARINGDRLERLVPAPADLLYNEATGSYRTLVPGEIDGLHTNVPFDGWKPLVSSGDGGGKQKAFWLMEAQFQQYLTGETITGDPVKPDTIFTIEERTGIAIDRRRRATRDQHLYHAQFARLSEGVGLLVGVNRDIFDEQGFINIGGEARSGHYQQVDFAPSPTDSTGKVKVILLTPAYFTGGWQPANADWSPWVGSGRLVSFAAQRPLEFSGWDMARRQPKPLRRYLPPGTVLYFEDATLNGEPFTETPPGEADFAAMGYGSFTTGIWK